MCHRNFIFPSIRWISSDRAQSVINNESSSHLPPDLRVLHPICHVPIPNHIDQTWVLDLPGDSSDRCNCWSKLMIPVFCARQMMDVITPRPTQPPPTYGFLFWYVRAAEHVHLVLDFVFSALSEICQVTTYIDTFFIMWHWPIRSYLTMKSYDCLP